MTTPRKNSLSDDLRRQIEGKPENTAPTEPQLEGEQKTEPKDEGMQGKNVIIGVFGAAAALAITAILSKPKGPRP